MRTFLLHLSILLLAALQVKAASLVLVVRDSKTQQALSSASIRIGEGDKQVRLQTNQDGKALLKEVQFPVRVHCSLVGYEVVETTLQEAALSKDGEQSTFLIQLQPVAIQVNEVVVTGQVKPVLATQSVYKVNTVSSTQIGQRGAVNLNEVLNYELNNFISNDNILGSSLSIGGIGGQNVKVLINGIPVMGRENGNIDLSQLNTNNIRRIEMIQGPMSVMYGSNAMGGVINLITQAPRQKFGFGMRTYLESIGRYNFSGNLNLSHKKHQMQLSAARNFFQGWTPNDSVDRFQIWKPKTQYTADLQYVYQATEKINLSYFGSYLNEKISNKGIPIVNPYEGYAFDEYYRTNRLIQSLSADFKLSARERFSMSNSFTRYHRTKNRFKKDLVSLDQFETKSAGDQDTSRFNALNLRGTLSSDRIKNTEVLLGYEMSHETGRSFKLAGDVQQMNDLGLFTSFLYKWKKVQIQPSARLTLNDRYSPGFTPALHAKWDVSQQIQWRGSYARGYRTPTLKELYLQFIDQNHTIIGNPDLKPETGHHAEIGLDYHRNLGKGLVSVSAQGSYNAIRNMITLAVYNSQGILRIYDNLDQYSNWIYGLQLKYRRDGLSVQSGASVIYVEPSGIVPRHQIAELSVMGAYLVKPLRTTVNLNYKFNSKQPVWTVDERFLFTQPLHIANASLQRRFFKESLLVQAGVKNLFNIQSTALSGAVGGTGSPHSGSSTGMQVFPARSIFFDLQYNF